MARRRKKTPPASSPPPDTTPVASAGRSRLMGQVFVVALVALAVGYAAWMRLRARRPNVLLVTVDTLRADHLGCYGRSEASTPALDALARRGVRFENAHAAVPITGPSHATILTGLYPPVHGVRDNVNFVLDSRHRTLASRLKKEGYRTAAFVAAYPLAAAFGFAQGFDHFSEGLHENPVLGQGAERPGNEVADAVLTWLAEPKAASHPAPFFAWMHLYDPHAPYAPPKDYAERFPLRSYDGEVAFADAQIGRVLDALTASGRDRDTVVVVVADHGEGLGEHDEATHAMLVYESTLHVPLLMAGPGIPEGQVVKESVGTIDLLPTLLARLGLPASPELLGRDLGRAMRGEPLGEEPLYAESLFGRLNCRWSTLRALTRGGWKLIDGAEPELYDLAADPRELRNQATTERARLVELRNALQAVLRRLAPQGDTARSVALSPEQEEKLRSLGYVGGSGGGGRLDEPGLPNPRTHVALFERLQVAMIAHGPAVRVALQETAAIAEKDPGNPFAHFTLASLAYRAGELALADQAFSRTLAIDPDRPGMRHYYGRLLREMGRLEESERQLRMAVEQTTQDDSRTRVNLAETLIARGSFAEAESLLGAVLAKEPRHLDARHGMGRLRMAEGRAADSIPFFEEAAHGREPDPWIDLALAYLAAGQAAKAEEAAAQALLRRPGHPWALAAKGHALVVLGRRDDGLAALRKALALRPRRPEVWMSLARGFEAAGDEASARLCRANARP